MFHPFDEAFSTGAFSALMGWIDIGDQKAIDTAKFIMELNEVYAAISNTIFTLFDHLALTKESLTDLLFKVLNRQSAINNVAFAAALNHTAGPMDMESIPFLKIENDDGEPVSLAASHEVLVDATAELIRLSQLWVPRVPLNDQPMEDVDPMIDLLKRAWVGANTIDNLRDNILDRLLYDQYYVEWTGERSVRIVGQAQAVDKIREVGGVRNSFHKHAARSGFRKAFEGFEYKRTGLGFGEVIRGQGRLVLEETNDDTYYVEAQSMLMTYHPYLATMSLTYFDNLSLADLATVFAFLLGLFRTKSDDVNDDLSSVPTPAWIERGELVTALAICSKIDEVKIEKLIECLIAEKINPYFWKTPFYAVGTKLYFALPTLVIPNHDLYYDWWLGMEQLSFDFQTRAFRDFVAQSMHDRESDNYSMELLEEGEDMESPLLRYSLIYRLRNRILLLEIATFPQPVKYAEHSDVLQVLNSAASRAKKARDFILEKKVSLVGDRKVLVAVLTTYPTYSGLTMNDVPVLDEHLLMNYLITGESVKAAIHFSTSSIASRPIARFSYYENEQEFNNNLAGFLRSPYPVKMIFDNLVIVNQNFTPVSSNMRITVDLVDRLDPHDITADKIELVDQLLTYVYYREPDEPETERIEKTVQYHFSLLLHKMAFSPYVPQEERWGTINALLKGKRVGNEQLMEYLLHTGVSTPVTLVKPKSNFEPVSPDDEVVGLFRRLMASLGENIQLVDFKIADIFNEAEEKQLISLAMDAINEYSYRRIDEDDIKLLSIYLVILYGFLDRHNLRNLFYSACSNVIELLNNEYHYQKARDLAEEILLLSIRDKNQAYAWEVLFDCYLQQNSFVEAAFYGCLFFASLGNGVEVDFFLYKRGLFTLLKFFRNFGYNEIFYFAYVQIEKLELGAKEKVQFDAVYYSVKFQELAKNNEAMDNLYPYLDEHREMFEQFGTRMVIPWLALLYNLKRLKDIGLYHTAYDLDGFINRLEKDCDSATAAEIQTKILGSIGQTKEQFLGFLMNAFETRSAADMANEIRNLTVPADVLVRESLANGDLNGILLSSLVLSDQTFVYRETKVTGERVRLIKEKDREMEDRLTNYKEYLLSSISLRAGQLLVWVFKYDQKEACLFIDAEKRISVSSFESPIHRDLLEWTKSISRFYFNQKDLPLVEYDLTAQENDYKQTLTFFSKTRLDYPGDFDELLVCTSTELAKMPHNLWVGKKDFIAAQKPVANVISLEYFARYSALVPIPVSFRMEAWIPTDDGNSQISWGYDLLFEEMEKYHVSIHTKRYPDRPLQGDINVFLAHGIRESLGFKFVRSGDRTDTSIIHPSGVFGVGTIAILFICNTGSAEDALYANQIISFSADLLKSGYKAVISSFWPYDVTMCRRWFTAFMGSLVGGSIVNMAVFQANSQLAVYDEEASQAFYAPAGRFAMHLYGNPNIQLEKSNGGRVVVN